VSAKRVSIDMDRLRQMTAAGWSLAAMAVEFKTSAYTVRSRMVENGISRKRQGRPRGSGKGPSRKKPQVRGPFEVPPEGLVLVGRTHQPCGICGGLVPIRNGCGHWRPVSVREDAALAQRREKDRLKQRRHRAAAAARVAEFQRQQGLT